MQFFPHRMVHLDFHTGPAVRDVGALFDPDRFAQAFSDAAVDSVTLFAKCHHGQLYYDTDRPERHPGLSRDIHLLEDQVAALHSVGIRAPIYLSVQCDEFAANTHPDWVAIDEMGRQVKWGQSPFVAGWQILDMSSPYQDYLADQIAEVTERFAPLDGVFLDMTWDQPSTSVWAKRAMTARDLDPADSAARDSYAHELAHEYMGRFRDQITPHLAQDVASGVWFNSRPKTALTEESEYVRHIEIESLPTGGWGYAYFPYVSRFVRQFGKPTLSHTGRFYKSWGDNGGIKPRAALLYECAQILAQGMTAGTGDLLHPSGQVNAVTYELIGSVYRHLRDCEPFVESGKIVADIAVVVDPALGDTAGPAGFGTVRLLQQLHHQFDLASPDADLSDYRLVIVPETTAIAADLAASLRARRTAGQATLIVRGAEHGWNGAEDVAGDLAELGAPSPYSHVFLRPREGLGATPGFDHVLYERSLRMKPMEGAETLVEIVEPYFERSWEHFSGHEYTPPSLVVSPWAGAVQRDATVLCALPLLSAFGAHASPAYRELVGAIIEALLPQPAVRTDAPVHVEVTAVRTPAAVVTHVLSFLSTHVAPELRVGHTGYPGLDLIEDAIPVVDAVFGIRATRRPSRAHLEPAGIELPLDWDGEYARTTLSTTDGHALIVWDLEGAEG